MATARVADDARHALRWSIGQLAQQAGVGVDTVRHYEQAGLLTPDHRRPSGVRRYGPPALKRLRFIRRARALGFSLETIADLLTLAGAPARARVGRQARLLADLDARLEALARVRRAIGHLPSSSDPLGEPDGILDALAADTPD
jgi:DNA-binding transcriptional MerR regulator